MMLLAPRASCGAADDPVGNSLVESLDRAIGNVAAVFESACGR